MNTLIVQVYRNLHRDLWSLRIPGGRVIDHRKTVVLRDAVFRVQPAGRRKVLASGQRNVHAYVQGTLVDVYPVLMYISAARYNPFRDDLFIDDDGKPVHQASWVIMEYPAVYLTEPTR